MYLPKEVLRFFYCATGKKHEHKVKKGNNSVMQTMNKQENIVRELAKCVTRMKALLCTLAA